MESNLQQYIQKAEQAYGSVMTYAAAAGNAGVAAWIGNNWFMLISALAVIIRIGIDLPKLIDAWKNRR